MLAAATPSSSAKCKAVLPQDYVPSSTIQSYIVGLKDEIQPEQIDQVKALVTAGGGNITYSYGIIKSFAAMLPVNLVTEIQASCMYDSLISYIEEDAVVTIEAPSKPAKRCSA
ncbi:hypothetical protein DSO57_1035177 [Entomophthora muscae]|uniref:Uncharacterized protein n=1 Tax=Entomophthora muscae TaxID=34485 RepID=A0ACC2S1K5_9FUNG|nr:hypothetical protein DSO57_1035177 [Entomophthora muscae]